MPTYEYICLNCANRFEQFQGINDKPLEECPQCKGPLRRLITGGSGFIMKGGSTDGTSRDSLQRPSCGKDTTCCGSQYTCGKSEGCHS